MGSNLPRRKNTRLDSRVYSVPGSVALLTACTDHRHPHFAKSETAEIVANELRVLHGDSWRVLGYCVMPDHLHCLVLNIEDSLIEFMRRLKGRTAARLRQHVSGTVWQRSFNDHLVRRSEDIAATLRYLLENPVRAGLVTEWTGYRWCGSFQWPDVGTEFFALNPSNILWDQLLGSQDGRG